MERRIVLDLDYCIGCRSCEAACKVAFKDEARIKHARISHIAFLPVGCRHCKDALCMKACPVDAITRDETNNRIVRASFKCTGCSSCVYACPFGVIDAPLLRHISQKCNDCRDWSRGPRCVLACSTGALKYLAIDQVEKIGIGIRMISRHPFARRR